jgi:cell division protein FtsZ
MDFSKKGLDKKQQPSFAANKDESDAPIDYKRLDENNLEVPAFLRRQKR